MANLNTTDILRSGGALSGLQRQNAVTQGIQQQQMNAENLKQLQQRGVMQQQQAEQQDALQQAAVEAFQSGDPNKIAELTIRSPELSERIMSARGIVDNAGKQRLSDRFTSVAISTNPRETLAAEIERGRAQGLDMSDSEQILNSDLTDEQIKQQALTSLAAVDGQRYKDISSSMQTAEPMTEYQQNMIRQKEVDQQLRQDELELKRLERLEKQEKTDLEKERLRGEIEAKQQKIEQGKTQKAQGLNTSIQTSNNLIESIDSFLNNDDYVSTVSGYSGFVPTVTPSGRDAVAAFDNIKNTLTLDNLSLMSGVLTDRDIKVLSSAAAALEEGMTEGALRKELNKVKSRVMSKIKKAEKQKDDLGVTITEEPQQQNLQPVRSAEDILKQYGIE